MCCFIQIKSRGNVNEAARLCIRFLVNCLVLFYIELRMIYFDQRVARYSIKRRSWLLTKSRVCANEIDALKT